METPFFHIENLHQRFGNQHVLKGVSFDVHRGELLALIGGSGAGKSVILKHLDGLMDPIEGFVSIDGQTISHAPEKEKVALRKKIGFMFQHGALFDSMTVEENIEFPLREAGIKDEKIIDERVTQALTAVGLDMQGHKMPSELSGGMIKRVAVARAIVMMPECLLYDEPTAGLDPIVTDSISYLIRNICKSRNITTIIVSHDMPSVTRIADRIIYLKNGHIYWSGTPLELQKSNDPILQNFLYGRSEENWQELNPQAHQLSESILTTTITTR